MGKLVDKLRIDVEEQDDGDVHVRVRILDRGLDGHSAVLSIEQKVVVKDSRPVNGSRTIWSRSFTASERDVEEVVPAHQFDVFTYAGEQIDIVVEAKVVVDDGFLWDTTLSEEIVVTLGYKPRVRNDASSIVDPHDAFSLQANIAALSPGNRVLAWGLVGFGSLFVTINSYLGIHDQAVNPVHAHVYGTDLAPPLVQSLIGSGVIGFGVWAWLRWLLLGYTTFELQPLPRRIDRDTSIPIGRLVTGRSRVTLWSPRIRVVACNRERGQYLRGHGTQQRTVSFTEPVRAVVLYDETVEVVDRGEPLGDRFPGEVSFVDMFDVLYPPSLATDSHGLDVYWEVQLIHDDFVDHEIVCPNDRLHEPDFRSAGD